MLRRSFVLALLFFIIPATGLAAPEHDLALQNISFSKPVLVAGQSVRVYARVLNNGTSDETAYVTFWQGGNSIGNSQLVTLKADSVPDEVFVDFTVPSQPFNIRAVVKGVEPGDSVPGNDEKVTPLITPLPDGDGDGITDSDDNCPEDSNADQKDNDRDGLGDACDGDDDNDGVSDADEATAGTNPRKADTDGDGVHDGDDVYPLDGSRTVAPPPPPPPAPLVAAPVASEPEETLADSSDDESAPSNETQSDNSEETAAPAAAVAEAPPPRPVPAASVRESGTEYVSSDRVGFWSFGNPYVKGILAVLFLASLGFIVAERVITRKYQAMTLVAPEPDEPPTPSEPTPPAPPAPPTSTKPAAAVVKKKPVVKKKKPAPKASAVKTPDMIEAPPPAPALPAPKTVKSKVPVRKPKAQNKKSDLGEVA